MDPFFAIFSCGAFLLGVILGSFINALYFRWGTSVSMVSGRSRCMRCGHTLAVVDLVPIFSWVFLRGRCRFCGVRISVQYPLVELLAGFLSLGAYVVAPQPLSLALSLALMMVMLFIATYDLRHFIIPWGASLTLMALALLWVGVQSFNFFALLAGPLLAAPLFFISFISGGKWMGWGDGALELSLGWFLGFTEGLTALMIAFWAGACVGIVLMALRRGVTMRSEVPFAPFLILGALVAYLFHVDLFQALPSLFQ